MTTRSPVKQSLAVWRVDFHADRMEALRQTLQARALEAGMVQVTSLSLNAERQGWLAVTVAGLVGEGESPRFAAIRCPLYSLDTIGEDLSYWAAEQGLDLSSFVSAQTETEGILFLVAAARVCS